MKLQLLVGVMCCALVACSEEPPRERKVQTVRLLPDTPPPPPPPPKPEDRPPPKAADKPAPAEARPAETPQAQTLKTDEAPGAGAGGGLSSGNVTQDYRGQAIGNAAEATVGGSRLAAAAYASAAARSLNEHLQRERDLRRSDWRLQVNVWLQADGRVARAELIGSTGDPLVDEALRAALLRFPGTATAPPERLPQPLRVQVSNRMIG